MLKNEQVFDEASNVHSDIRGLHAASLIACAQIVYSAAA